MIQGRQGRIETKDIRATESKGIPDSESKDILLGTETTVLLGTATTDIPRTHDILREIIMNETLDILIHGTIVAEETHDTPVILMIETHDTLLVEENMTEMHDIHETMNEIQEKETKDIHEIMIGAVRQLLLVVVRGAHD